MSGAIELSVTDPPAFVVWVRRDAAKGVWYVEHSDIPGLNAEATSFDELVGIICDVAADLVPADPQAGEAGRHPGIPVRVQHLVTAKRAHAA